MKRVKGKQHKKTFSTSEILISLSKSINCSECGDKNIIEFNNNKLNLF